MYEPHEVAAMELDFELSCDQLNSTNHTLLIELSLSTSCRHILKMCIPCLTYMDTLPLNFRLSFILTFVKFHALMR